MAQSQKKSLLFKIVLIVIAGSFIFSSLSQRQTKNPPILTIDEEPLYFMSDFSKLWNQAFMLLEQDDPTASKQQHYFQAYQKAYQNMLSLGIKELISKDFHLSIAPERVRNVIKNDSQFMESGIFDEKKLKLFLDQKRMTEVDYMRFIHIKLVMRQIKRAVKKLTILNPVLRQKITQCMNQKLSGRYWKLNPENIIMDPVNNERDRHDFFDWLSKNNMHPKKPDIYQVDMIVWSPESIKNTLEPTPLQIQEAFLKEYAHGGTISSEIQERLREKLIQETIQKTHSKIKNILKPGMLHLTQEQRVQLEALGCHIYDAFSFSNDLENLAQAHDLVNDLNAPFFLEKDMKWLHTHIKNLEKKQGYGHWHLEPQGDFFWCMRFNHQEEGKSLEPEEMIHHVPSIEKWREEQQEVRIKTAVESLPPLLPHKDYKDPTSSVLNIFKSPVNFFEAVPYIKFINIENNSLFNDEEDGLERNKILFETILKAEKEHASIGIFPYNRDIYVVQFKMDPHTGPVQKPTEEVFQAIEKKIRKQFFQSYFSAEQKRRVIDLNRNALGLSSHSEEES